MYQTFADIDTWIFDLDNTLYPPSCNLFGQIDVLMTKFVMQALDMDWTAADTIRQSYWDEYGNTLAGLMDRHAIPPDDFLDAVHDIDLSALVPAPTLADAIVALPGRKLVYTNGTRTHAQRVTKARGIHHVFDEMYGVEDADHIPKPKRRAFEIVFNKAGVDPNRAAFFEDEHRNLEMPKEMGVATVHVGPRVARNYIDHHTDDLTHFLSQLRPTAA